MKKLSRDL